MAAAIGAREDILRGQPEELRRSGDDTIVASSNLQRRDTRTLLVFEVGSAAFALSTQHLSEVVCAKGMVAVPCSPPQIAGAIAHRREVVSALDLGRVLQMPGRNDAKPRFAIVLRPGAPQCAILADCVVGIRRVSATRLPGVEVRWIGSTIVTGKVTIDGRTVAIVDTESQAFAAAPIGRPEAPRATGGMR